MHSKKALEDIHFAEGAGMGLSHVQTKIITGAFDLADNRVETIITPIEKIFSISIDALLDIHLINEMRIKGYSRIPIYYGSDKSFIIGILIVKTLIGADV